MEREGVGEGSHGVVGLFLGFGRFWKFKRSKAVQCRQPLGGEPRLVLGCLGWATPAWFCLAMPVMALLCLTMLSFAWMVSIVTPRVFLHNMAEPNPLLLRGSPGCQSGTIPLWCRMWIVF